MLTYKNLKSVTYINKIIPYVEGLLKIQFKPYGNNKYTAFCPFHADTKDSFRVYVNDKNDVRFHCFGSCNTEWDVYNLIMLRKKCSFAEAQLILAKAIDVKDFEMFSGKSDQPPEQADEPDESATLMEPEVLSPEIIELLERAAQFYNDLLLSGGEKVAAIHRYLNRRGVDEKMIRNFKIGFCPPFNDENSKGRALLNKYLGYFNTDHQLFHRFNEAGLFRLLNDENVKGSGFYRQQIDFTKRDPFSSNGHVLGAQQRMKHLQN
jgi:DNA primase